MIQFFKNTLSGTFGFAAMGVYGALFLGGLYWWWMAFKMGSFLMFVVGVIPPAYVVTAPVGLYSMVYGPPHWVISWFGNNKTGINWTDENKTAYVNECVGGLVNQKVAADNSQKFCHCTVTALQSEFGEAEYDAMVKAQPNPNGNDVDRRLYKVMQSCSKLLAQ